MKSFIKKVCLVTLGAICLVVVWLYFSQKRINRVLGEFEEENRTTIRAKVGLRGFKEQKYEKCVDYLELALTDRTYTNSEANAVLAECYMKGLGCKTNLARSRRHAEKAAGLGNARGVELLKQLDELQSKGGAK